MVDVFPGLCSLRAFCGAHTASGGAEGRSHRERLFFGTDVNGCENLPVTFCFKAEYDTVLGLRVARNLFFFVFFFSPGKQVRHKRLIAEEEEIDSVSGGQDNTDLLLGRLSS